MTCTKNLISTAIAPHEHTYRFPRSSGLPLGYFKSKPPLLTVDEWVLLVCCLAALAAVFT